MERLGRIYDKADLRVLTCVQEECLIAGIRFWRHYIRNSWWRETHIE